MSNYQTATGGESGLGEARKVLREAGEGLKSEAQSFASVAGERMWTEADKAAQVATKTIGDLAHAVRRAGEALASSDQHPGSRWAGKAAIGLEDLSGALSSRRPEELIDTVRSFGRRNPALFVGGAVVLGIALGRFLRSADGGRQGDSSRRAELDHDRDHETPLEATGTTFPHVAGADRYARSFGVDEAPSAVLSVDDGHSDPNAEPHSARPGS